MLAVTRCAVPLPDHPGFLLSARTALEVLAIRPGYLRGRVGQSGDDPDDWVLATEWAGVGPYRRGLSAYDVKVALAPLMAFVVNEPSGYEVRAAVDTRPEPQG